MSEQGGGRRATSSVWIILAILLAGLYLRTASLATLSRGLNYDEAWYALNAADLLQHPRLTPYFPENFGRESGWMYWLAAFMAGLGPTRFAARIAAAGTGVLTLAALQRLGHEVFRRRAAAVWATAALAVFFWHVQFSQQALRGNFFVFVSALAGAAFLRAQRRNTRPAWLTAGLALGLLAYTYFSSFALIAWLAALLIITGLRDPRRRTGAGLALAVAAASWLPLGLYIWRQDGFQRAGQVADLNIADILLRFNIWLSAWLQAGDPNIRFNLPGRPILDPLTAALTVAGLVGLRRQARSRQPVVLLAGWAVAILAPAVLADPAPHFLRAAAVMIPLAVLMGAGAAWLGAGLRRLAGRPWAAALPAVLLVLVGADTYHDFHVDWVRRAEIFMLLEQPVNLGYDYLAAHPNPPAAGQSGPATPVYFSPFDSQHPAVRLRQAELAPRRVGTFASAECLVLPDGPADYVSVSAFEDLPAQLAPWASLQVLAQDSATPSRYIVFRATPLPMWRAAVSRPAARFGGAVDLYPLQGPPALAPPGAALTVTLGFRASAPLAGDYSAFVHVYGNPGPEAGGPLWTQRDRQLCPSHPPAAWQPDEVIVMAFALALPAEMPPGQYRLAVGLYLFPQGERLAVTPATPDKAVVPYAFTVCAPGECEPP